ncbi:MAG TPA: TolC family protein [Phycisphaerales bacterium]|nr:TolC family protein [Phycisphaerales bacterium]
MINPRPRASRRAGGILTLTLPPAAVALLVAGCGRPLFSGDDDTLRRSIAESAGRELADARRTDEQTQLTRPDRVEALGIKPSIREQLEGMAGPGSYGSMQPRLGDPLVPGDQKIVAVSLERAIAATVRNNLDVEFARIDPAIASARVVQAQAAFDWVLFSNSQWTSIDSPRTSSNAFSQAVRNDEQQQVDVGVGLRRRLTTGGQLSIAHNFRYTDVETSGLTTFPDPAYEPSVTLQLDQPLLRNSGSDVALSQVRLNRNAELEEIQALKQQLLLSVTQTEEAYWTLVRAYNDLLILQRLLERGTATSDFLQRRRALARPAHVSDAAANVQTRQANVIRAQRTLRQASNRLKQLMNDPQLTVGSEVLVLPADVAIDAPIRFNLADAVLTALRNRPEIQRALLSIDNTSIRQELAENALLPLLDLRVQTRVGALGEDTGDAYNELDADFVDYLVSLNFELPVGNRAAQATERERHLQRVQSVIAYRNTLQGVVAEVRNALIEITTNYQLIEQTRAARVAAAENLRTIELEQELLEEITTDFLDLRLRRQQLLALAEQEEVQSLIDYNTSLARLYAAMGTALARNRILLEVPDAPQLAPTSPLFPLYPLAPEWQRPRDYDREVGGAAGEAEAAPADQTAGAPGDAGAPAEPDPQPEPPAAREPDEASEPPLPGEPVRP